MPLNITQVRRVYFRKKATAGGTWTVVTFDIDDLGQDTVASINIAPRKRSRASQAGTTESPIAGTLDNFTASITFLMDTFKKLGLVLNRWQDATYADADANAGQISGGDTDDFCSGDEYWSVIIQGVCEDGSATDIEICRCQPSVDDDLEFGSSETMTTTLNLNPIIYNPSLHSADGYTQKSYNFGEYDTAKKMHFNALTGEYTEVL